jgi:hypothetical protein
VTVSSKAVVGGILLHTAFQDSLCTSSFWVIYGRDPLAMRSYSPGDARSPVVQQQLMDHDEFFIEVHERLEQAQSYQKLQYNGKHR